MTAPLGVWFPAVRVGTGVDVFTERLCQGLNRIGIRAEVSWLPARAEYLPWTVAVPKAPEWASVVHVNTWLHPRFIPTHLPVVATLHHSVHDPALRPYKGWLRATYHRLWVVPIERKVMQEANRVVAVSQFAADMARKTLCEVPIQVIPNGIDTVRFHPAENPLKPHQPFRLLYVGNWMNRKGVDLLAPIMRELGDGFMLYYTGGPASEKDKPTMPSNMVDIGRLSSGEVVAAMQRADAFLFPSRSEGLPLVLMEAMACGLPVIAADATSLPEVVQDGVTGFLCCHDDMRSFTAAIRRLAEDAALVRSMAAAALATATRHFDHQGMVHAYKSVYCAAIDAKP